MKMRIWLSSGIVIGIVIILIFLLGWTVNHAREKDMIKLFSREQLSYAQNTAVQIAEIFRQSQKNIDLFVRSVQEYEKKTRGNQLGYLCIADENDRIIVHPDTLLAGKTISGLLRNRTEHLADFSRPDGGSLELLITAEKDSSQKSIVSYYPFTIGEKRWVVLVIAPFPDVVSPVRKTFIYSLFISLLLIMVVIIVSMSFAYNEGKRLRIEEERKRLEEREAWQEKLLREKKTIDGIIEGSPIPTFVIDKEHKVILWNRACEELTGFPAGEMVGTDNHYLPFYSVKRPVIADLIIHRDLDGLNKYYGTKKVKKSEKVVGAYEANDYFENLGGQRRYMYFLAAPIFDERGEIIAAIETLQDVSREQELAKSLREYAETLQNELAQNIDLRREIEEVYNYLQTIVKSLPDKIFELNTNGIVSYMSRSWKKESNIAQREFKGKHFMDFVSPEDKDFVWARWEEAKKGIFKPYEIDAVTTEGRKVNLLITISPVIGTDRYLVVQRDITEFKNLEKKLYDSQKLAALGQLSAGIAHEVRNPLSSIKMSLQILEKRMNPEGNDLKRFKIAEKEVEHLEELVNNVLLFARPIEPKKVNIKLEHVLEQALAMAEKGIAEKHINLERKLENSGEIFADEGMLADAFLNIIRNALDAVEDGGGILLSSRYSYENRESVVVSIRDNGCGIDAEDIPHLFNPFFTRKKYGTGLGLSQVKKIIDLHQGSIDILSEKGKGTTVIVILPVIAEKELLAGPVNI